ncbi:MAG: hypothetical protein KAJ62_05925 [Desulfobacteraceae bacterium]|nr:hypothetical protein [Desulfobacteraceae bacterium]
MDAKNLKKWSETHSPFVSLYSSFVATCVESISEQSEVIKNKTILKIFGDVPSIKQWLQFYNTDPISLEESLKMFKNYFDVEAFLPKNLQFYGDFINENDDTADISGELFDELCDELEINTNDDKNFVFEQPELKFFFTVTFPCFLFYTESYQKLFKQAQEGSMESLDKILRLDPSVLGDPLIFQHFHHASKQENQMHYDIMASALQKPLKGKVDIKKIKYQLAGLIAFISERLFDKLSAPEIVKLFRALAEDCNRPELALGFDTDKNKSVNNESIAQHIRREKQFWENLVNPYIK